MTDGRAVSIAVPIVIVVLLVSVVVVSVIVLVCYLRLEKVGLTSISIVTDMNINLEEAAQT